MAAALRQHSKVILSRAKYFEQNLRNISSSSCLFGNTWHIFDKPKRKKDFIPVETPIELDKTPEADLKPIIIPDKIERSPTAILEALASTVKNDINQPMYKSIDDPHLYCTSDRTKRSNLAAMDSGRKTARMMMSMYPEYITQIWEEPLPEVWRDINQGYIHKEPSEAALLERIAKRNVPDAIKVYEAVNPKSQFSQETLEKFLELLTIYSNENFETKSDIGVYIDPPMFSKDSPFPINTWKNDCMAEQVFQELLVKTCAAYCYMIRGKAVNFDKAGAMDLYREMKAANMIADVLTYNILLSVASLDVETLDDFILESETLLKDMAASGVKPNAQTFNAVLYSCNRTARWSGCRKFALSVLSEMKALDIEPTLAAYVQLLKIFYHLKDSNVKNPDLFLSIINNVENKEYHVTCENDLLFFRTAMKVISTHFPDSKLALRLHKILKTGKNADLIGHQYLEFTYYSDFLLLLTQLEHTDVVMDVYNSVCPFIFFPTSEIYMSLFDNISLHNTFHYIPQVYADLQTSHYFKDKSFTLSFFKTIALHKNEAQLQSQLCDVVQSFLKIWQQKKESLRPLSSLDGDILGEMIIIYLNNDDIVKASEIFNMYVQTPEFKTTNPSALSLNKLAKKLISVEDYETTKNVLSTMLALDYEGIPALVETCLDSLQLSTEERMYLEGLSRSAPSDSSSDSGSSSENASSSDSESD
ncbi:hypothetical protein Btru_004520 [Bulinus truncatus]|nr:hypothetical protein Btru_004520 [Bulinus truncatus]